jgi:hypothetical protein
MSVLPLDDVIERAAVALASARGDDGLWRDFQTLAGESCDWVTAFVAYAVGRSRALEEAAHQSVRLLYYRQRPSGGWGYNDEVPPDCDSTAWVLLAASTTTLWRPSAIRRALAYIRAHWDPANRGFRTYNSADGIAAYIEAPRELTAGWTSAHPCVTAVALQSVLMHGVSAHEATIREAVAALREKQDASGLWPSYWWRGPTYGTHHALRALSMAEALAPEVWIRARDGLIACQNADGGWGDTPAGASYAFASAMGALALLLRPDDDVALDHARRGIEFLVHSEEGGLWPAAPILRIPAPMTSAPAETDLWPVDVLGTNTIVTDQRGVFTTAAVLWSLSVARDVL